MKRHCSPAAERFLRLLAGLLFLLPPAIGGAGPAPAQIIKLGDPVAGYRATVKQYRTGQTADAVENLAKTSVRDLQGIVTRLIGFSEPSLKEGGLDAAHVRAAAMLHTDAAADQWTLRQFEEAYAHLELARRWADHLEPGRSLPGSFRRRWYLVSGLMLAGRVELRDALTHFARACETFPDDVPLLMAAGWLNERAATAPASAFVEVRQGADRRGIPRLERRSGPVALQPARTAKAQGLERARRFLAAAVKIDSLDGEAALRLARVEGLLDHPVESRQLLESLVSRRDGLPVYGYLARLFLADLHERNGNHDAAAKLYREAIALMPPGQSARSALAHLLYSEGDAAGAADAIGPFLRTDAFTGNDPWAAYVLANIPRAEMLRQSMRAEVQQ